MDRILLVTHDLRVSRQVRSWFEDLTKKTSLQIESDLQSFLDTETQKTATLSGAGPPEGAGPPVKGGSGASGDNGISLVILDCSNITNTKPGWIKNWKTRFKDSKISPPEQDTLFLLIVPDDPHFTPDNLVQSGADDVVMNDNDREIFLQKIEILLARGEPISPSYIFRLKSEFDIEMAKACIIEELSEMEVVIRNPVPIKPGTHSGLHASFFGDQIDSRVNVQVLESKKAPDSDHEWLLRLRFFGLTAKQVSQVRRKMKDLGEEKKYGDRSNAKGRQYAGLFSEPEPAQKTGRPLRIAVIDPDPSMAKIVKMALEEEAVEVQVRSYLTPARLISDMRKASGKAEKVQQDPAQVEEGKVVLAPDELDLSAMVQPTSALPETPAFPSGVSVTAIVNTEGSGVVKFDPPIDESLNLMGYKISQFLDKPDLLTSSVTDGDREAFQELLDYVALGGKCEAEIEFRDAKGKTVGAMIRGERLKSAEGTMGALLSLEVLPAKEKQAEPKSSLSMKENLTRNFGFDAIIIEARFLATDPEAKALFLREEFVRNGVFSDLNRAPSLYVVAEEGSSVKPEKFRVLGVAHFAWKIPDRRHILETFKTFAPAGAWKSGSTPTRHLACRIPASIARRSTVQEISEFGIVVKEPKPFRSGVFLRFFAPILGREEEGVLARCVASRQGEDGWSIEFVFFGSSDEFQKRIRRHVQEDYARKKEKESAA